MFYLKNFFKIIKENLISGTLLISISLVLVIYMGNMDLFKNKIIGLYPEYLKGPYFYALLSGNENHSRIKRKLLLLPGINNVNIIEKSMVKNRALEILDNLSMGKEDEFNFDYVGLEVSLSRDVNARSEDLIRSYLKRLAGEENITLGKMYPPSIGKNLKKNLDIFNDYGGLAIGFLLFSFWMLALFSLRKKFKQIAYLVEQYQRKKGVEIKIILSGISLFFLIGCLISYSIPTTEWIKIAGIGGVFCVLLALISGRPSWEN